MSVQVRIVICASVAQTFPLLLWFSSSLARLTYSCFLALLRGEARSRWQHDQRGSRWHASDECNPCFDQATVRKVGNKSRNTDNIRRVLAQHSHSDQIIHYEMPSELTKWHTKKTFTKKERIQQANNKTDNIDLISN